MENSIFKAHLIRKLIVAGGFTVLTIGAVIGITLTNANVIAPNEGFITAELCNVEVDGAKNNMGDKLAVEIEQEGIVLAKNDNNVLPLSKEVKHINVFGYDAVEWVISNSGSGSADGNKSTSDYRAYGIIDAFTERGIGFNDEIIKYYEKWATPRNRDTKSYSSNYDTIYRLTNPSLSNNADYAELYNAAKSDTDTAIVCIGRYGGEHLDPPHEQVNNYKAAQTRNPDRGYLEITLEEEELLTAVGQDYENVIVIINSTNVMQMDFMREIPGLDACLLVGPTGSFGYRAIPQVLYGEVNPSGRTADTWPMNHRYNVSYYTSGFWSQNGNSSNAAEGSYYTGVPNGANLANSNNNAGHGHAIFADYYEGIYVGYKWYETADKEGFWNDAPYNGYENVVAYPFGYGLSYTTFKWNMKSVGGSSFKANEELNISVEVTNTGEKAGRDVIELYLTAPYTKGGIEKASVQLVGFQKTDVLMPGESRTYNIPVNTRDFMSFDCYDANNDGHAGYELEKGDYVIKALTDAHNLRPGSSNNTVTYTLHDTIHVDEDDKTGNEVKPLFTGDDAIDGVSIDGKSINEPIEYLTRANFAPLMTEYNHTRQWNPGLVTCDDNSKPTAYSTNMAKEWDDATTDVFGKAVPSGEPTFGASNGLAVLDDKGQLTELGIKLAQDYNDPEWDALLDQLSWSDATTIPAGQSYSRPGMKSVGLTKQNNNNFSDAEGACMVGASVNGKHLTAYPDPCLQAQTWNENMLYLFGLSEAKDMALGNKDFLYGPASNIHRNPYGGRHAEYHSEDGFLAGRCLANVTKGLSDGGKNGFIKHFVANDTEYHRVGLFTWMTEQALREIYLRPFEESIKRGEGSAVMSSFNRVGAVWTGGSQALCQGVLRNEWGFNGMMITDYTENGTLQDANQMVRAGGNYILASSNFSDPTQSKATARFKWRMRESAKQVVFGTISPLYRNYLYNSDTTHTAIVATGKAPWIWWKPALYSVEGLVIVGLAFGIIAALLPSNPEFRAELIARLFKKKREDAQVKEE